MQTTNISSPKNHSFFNYLDFFVLQGRINRIKFLGLYSFWFTTLFFFYVLKSFLPIYLGPIIFACVAIIVLVNLIFLKLRRLSDVGYSRYYFLLFLIPLVNVVFLAALFLIKGTNNNKIVTSDPSHNMYFYFSFMIPIVLTFVLLANYTGKSAKLFHSWKIFNDFNYSIEFPDRFSITKNENNYKIISSDADDYSLIFKATDYSNNDLIIDLSADQKNVISTINTTFKAEVRTIYSDKAIEQNGLSGRLVEGVMFSNNLHTENFFRIEMFDDPVKKRFYTVFALYDDNNKLDGDIAVINYFFKSFKTKN